MSLADRDMLPNDTPILVGQFGSGHRITPDGPACGSQEQTRPSRALNAVGWGIPPCVPCWGGGRPW